jgi:glycosyltransferase involved in cell wall biosynthesis
MTVPTSVHPTGSSPLRCAMLSTYPPTPCGLATFSQALVTHLSRLDAVVDVVRVVEQHEPIMFPEVVRQLMHGSARSVAQAVAVLNDYDLVVVQHEYGIYAGPDGEALLGLLDQVRVPILVVLHTVLTEPTARQRRVLQAVVDAADMVVTMTHAARRRLLDGYLVPEDSVRVIPHGAIDHVAPHNVHDRLRTMTAPVSRQRDESTADRRPVILTWGLLGEGKGIEWGIEAMAGLRELVPAPIYVVAGRTHPRVLERYGDVYRQRLEQRVSDLDLSDAVVFENRYLDADELRDLVGSADIVLLPYDSREQVTSGVLTEAVVAGKPVVSTAFPHAVELLAAGSGLLVPQRDPAAIERALRRLLTEPGLAAAMSTVADRLSSGLSWHAVAAEYLDLGLDVARSAAASSGALPRADARVAVTG